MLLVSQRVDVEQLTHSLKAGGHIFGRLLTDEELLPPRQQVDQADHTGGQEGQLVGHVGGILVESLQHQAVGKGARRVQQAVGNGQAQGQPALGVFAVGVLLTLGPEGLILPRLHDAQTDDAQADQRHSAQHHSAVHTHQVRQVAGDQAGHGHQSAGGIADGRGDGQLNVAQAHIAQGHGQDVEQGDGQIAPDDLPGDSNVVEENHIGRMEAHDQAHGGDHFQMGRAVLFTAAANLGKDVGAAPAQQSDNGKPKPVHFIFPLSFNPLFWTDVTPPAASSGRHPAASVRKAGCPAWRDTRSDRPGNKPRRADEWGRRQKAQWTSPEQRPPPP